MWIRKLEDLYTNEDDGISLPDEMTNDAWNRTRLKDTLVIYQINLFSWI